jgi:polar amino acid transport system permease protein
MFSTLHELLTGSFPAQFLHGLIVSIELFCAAWIAAMVLGTILTVARSASAIVGASIVAAFVSYHRSVPAIVQILVWYFGVPQLLPDTWQAFINAHNAQFLFAVVALSLNSAAYISEDLRTGFRTLPHTQQEAARALGLSYLQTMWLVLIPQAIRAALPALIGQTLSLFKSTSLTMAIGVADLMYMTRQIEGETYATFGCYLIATVVYLGGTTLIAASGGLIQRSLQKSAQR